MSWNYRLGIATGFFFGNILRHRRTEALAALERSIPGKSKKEYRRIINAMYRNLGVNITESIRFFVLGLEKSGIQVELENREIADEALAKGKGAIMVTCHFGNFDLMPFVTSAKGFKSTTIVKKIRSDLGEELWSEYRQCEGASFVPAKNSLRACIKALRRNEMIGFMFDQNMTLKEGIFVDFFGRPACTTPGLAYMAHLSRAPVIPVFFYRKGIGRHVEKFLPPMDPPADNSPEAIHEATQRYTKVLEDGIRATPDHWIWIHRRWRTIPHHDENIDPTRRVPK